MMSDADFFTGITGQTNDLERVVAVLRQTRQPFCLIGGLAVNHYVEPVVTLDADFAIAAAEGLEAALRAAGFAVEAHPHSLNAILPGSRLRIQITINHRYASFPARAKETELFGVRLPVASLEDLVQGKLWAAGDASRRATKRQKDRLDLARICEAHPDMIPLVPAGVVPEVDEMRKQHE